MKNMQYPESQFEKDKRAAIPKIEHPKFVPAKSGPPFSKYGKWAEQIKWSPADCPKCDGSGRSDTGGMCEFCHGHGGTDEDQFYGGIALRLAWENAGAIDPETAEVCCFYEAADDLYGIYSDWKSERVPMYYARAPWSDVWVWFGQLPVAVRDALWAKHREKLLKNF
jgi:hypothetical protein